ncbi:MAG TPA: hypothetical protein VFI90_15120 [Rubrobacter sp.]|nr:hypothetical protein [Rubrobacter sp.]
MSDSIDPRSASPTEFLRWLQIHEANHPSAFGSWSSRAASESLRNRAALEEVLEQTSNFLRNSLTNVEENEQAVWDQTLSEHAEGLLGSQFPTNAGNLAYYSTLTGLIRDAEHAAARLGYELPEAVTFGLLPTGRVNGLACAVPAGGLIVAIDDGLFNFLYSLAKAIATFCEVTVTDFNVDISWIDKDIVRAVRANEEANRRWLEALVATFVYGYPNVAPMRPLLDHRAYLVAALVTAVEFFVVAHEFGHLILGHYERNHVTSKQRLSSGAEVEEINTEMEEELEADRLGLDLLREHHRSLSLSLDNTRWAIWFWAGCLNIIEEMLGTASTHPPASMRSERLLQRLAREDGTSITTPSLGLYIYRVMEALWFHNEARFAEWENRALSGEVPWHLPLNSAATR